MIDKVSVRVLAVKQTFLDALLHKASQVIHDIAIGENIGTLSAFLCHLVGYDALFDLWLVQAEHISCDDLSFISRSHAKRPFSLEPLQKRVEQNLSTHGCTPSHAV